MRIIVLRAHKCGGKRHETEAESTAPANPVYSYK